jgi:trafficking protein particle complex subunit 1
MIYNLYIFDKYGTLLHYAEWNRIKQCGITRDEVNTNSQQFPITLSNVLPLCLQEAKLMYGMLFSIKSFVSKISPYDTKEGFLYYKTNKYALHYLETLSGLKFVLNTDNLSTGAKEFMQNLYSKVWIEYAVRNPLWQPGTPITSELFKVKLDEFVRQSPLFIKSV